MTSTLEPSWAPGRDRPGPGRGGSSAPRGRVSLRDDRWPDRAATLVALLAAVVVVTWFVHPLHHYFARVEDPISLVLLPVVPNLVYAALLGALAVGLRRRIRTAWWLFVLLLLVVPVGIRVQRLLIDRDPVLNSFGIVVSVVLLVVAVRTRPQFSARTARRAALRAGAAFVAGTLVVGALGSWVILRFTPEDDPLTAVARIADTLIGDLGLLVDPGPGGPRWVRMVVGLLGAAVVLGSAAVLFRAPRFTRVLGARDEGLVRGFLRDHGDHDSLGYFATRRDKAVVWDADDPARARAGVSYRVVNGVTLASGNPLGDPARWPDAIAAWKRVARENGWSLAVMAPGESGARAFEAAGLTAFEIGDEAILDVADFSLDAPGLRPVRQAVSRLRRRGYRVEVRRHGTLSDDDLAALALAAASWRGDGGDERGFSMALGRLGDPLDADCVLVEARDASGTLRGFLSLVPWGRSGLSLDLMRRDPTADNGLVELLVTSLAEQAPRMQVRFVSLNFAMFREAFSRGEELGAGPLARLGRQALLLASRNWQLESLYRSNAKYLPRWEPRFICFEYASDLPRIGVAAGNAEGFLTAPTVSSLVRRGRGDTPALERADERYAAQVLEAVPPQPDHLGAALARRRLPEQERVRRAKLEALRENGIDPYPVGYPRTHALSEVAEAAGAEGAAGAVGAGERHDVVVGVTGRVLLKRDHGGLTFLTLRDGSGDLQVMASRATLGDEPYARFRALDLGDHVGVTGPVVTTRAGEPTVDATSFALTSKALRPLPDKHRGLTDPEARVRMRYVDLVLRPQARDIAHLRSTVVRSLRESLHARGYVEVETPVLQLVHGGANARPFQTHSNAYDLDLSLRIATELHLKRLVVGGMERVFEIGRQFRNEGADSSHNPEFTSLEVYGTYEDYVSMRHLTRELVQEAATAVFGSPVARRIGPDGRVTEVDLSGEWPAVPICEAVSAALGEQVTPATPIGVLRGHADRLGLEVEPSASWGVVLEKVYGELCEGRTTTPVFYTDFPRDTSPLTRVHRTDPRLVEKWDLVAWGSEQATAYSELIDPVDQRTRLVEQSLLAAAGDPEAMEVDEDFLAALEYGMPPTGGMGLGVDRLVMNLTGLGIRDTILFPLVRPS